MRQLNERWRYLTPGETNNSLANSYKLIYNKWTKVIINQKSVLDLVPDKIEDCFSQNRLGLLIKEGLYFPPLEQIFQKSYFKNCSKKTSSVFLGFQAKDFYQTNVFYNKYYRTLSDYVHNAILSTIDIRTRKDRSKFWINTLTQMTSLLFLELVDQKVGKIKGLESLLKEIKKKSPDYAKLLKVEKS